METKHTRWITMLSREFDRYSLFPIVGPLCIVWSWASIMCSPKPPSQTQYISSLLAILATACAKCAFNLVIMAINDLGNMFYASRVLIALILLTTVSSLLATAFQCPLPTPWFPSSTTCPGAASIYEYTAIASMITDTLLCVLSTAMVWILQDRWAKVVVITLFASRILYGLHSGA